MDGRHIPSVGRTSWCLTMTAADLSPMAKLSGWLHKEGSSAISV
jgi:hypothetical protein